MLSSHANGSDALRRTKRLCQHAVVCRLTSFAGNGPRAAQSAILDPFRGRLRLELCFHAVDFYLTKPKRSGQALPISQLIGRDGKKTISARPWMSERGTKEMPLAL